MSDPNVMVTLTARVRCGAPPDEPHPTPGLSQAELEELKAGLLRLAGIPCEEDDDE